MDAGCDIVRLAVPTVEAAETIRYLKSQNSEYTLVDGPGTYSLYSHSPEEEIARNFICSGEAVSISG